MPLDRHGDIRYSFYVHMAKRLKVPMSSARARLFHLADLVRHSRDDTVVILEGRGGVEPLALVREARLAFLEDQVSRVDPGLQTFVLAGSLSTDLDDEALTRSLRELREAWTDAGRNVSKRKTSAKAPKVAARPRRRR